MNKLKRIIQKKFSNIFIAIISEKNEYLLTYIIIKNENIIKKDEKKFSMDENKQLSSDIIEFISSLQKKYKFVYISYLLDSLSQNCLPTCDDKKLKQYNINQKDIVSVCVKKTWMAYASKTDIKWINQKFKPIGLDFTFSSFLLLNNFATNAKQRNKNTLHMQYMENSLTILIFDNKNIVFSAFFKIPYKEFNFEEDELKLENDEDITSGIELENIESEEEEFEAFVDISKLEEDNFDDDNDILSSAQEDIKSSSIEDLELYGREVIIFKYLQSAIEEYYKSDNYSVAFIDDVIIYNDSNISNDIINMIENDLFLNVEIHKIDVREEIINMSIEEVDF